MNKDLELARRLLHTEKKTLVLVKEGVVLGTGERQGVVDLLALAETLDGKAKGAALADRVMGRAAAMVALSMGIQAVYAEMASEPGRAALEEAGVPLVFDRIVPGILNRTANGPCPLENLVSSFDEPAAAVAALRAFLSRS